MKNDLPDVSTLCFARKSREHCDHHGEDGYCCDCNQWSPEMCQVGCGQSKEDHLDSECSSGGEPRNLVFDLVAHIKNQQEWSFKTFGPLGQGQKPEGVINHLEKELKELRAKPTDLEEWIDVVILGIDGATKGGYTPEQIATMLMAKQVKNENRKWPDWRTMDQTKAIEHDRTGEQVEMQLDADSNPATK